MALANYKAIASGSNWRLACELREDGSVKGATVDRITAAAVLCILDEAKEQTKLLRIISRKLTKPRKRRKTK